MKTSTRSKWVDAGSDAAISNAQYHVLAAANRLHSSFGSREVLESARTALQCAVDYLDSILEKRRQG